MKLKFTLFALLCTYAAATAQIPKNSAAKKPVSNWQKKESRAFKRYDLRDLNRPKMVNSPFGNSLNGANISSSSARAMTRLNLLHRSTLQDGA